MAVREKIVVQLAQLCAIDPSAIRDDAWLIEYGLDSVRSLELVLTLENTLGIELAEEEIGTIVTVGDLLRVIEKQLAPP